MAVFFYDVDDTDASIKYSTGWNVYPDTDAYGGSVTSTFNDATASFQFSGKAVSVQCAKLLDVESNDSAVFNLDDGPWTPIQVSYSTDPLFTCWSSDTLASDGPHTLNIKNVNGGTPLRIDKITYMVVLPETTSSSSTSTDSTSSTPSSFTSPTSASTDLTPLSTSLSGPESSGNRPLLATNVIIAITSVLAVVIGCMLGCMFMWLYLRKCRRFHHEDSIFDTDMSYLPPHIPEFDANRMKQRTILNDINPPLRPQVPRPEPTYSTPLPSRDGVDGPVFPRRQVYDLEANAPLAMTSKPLKLRNTIIFPHLPRNPVRSTRG